MTASSEPRLLGPNGPRKTMITDRLSYPATVTHPTMRGELQTFDVTIHSVYLSDDAIGDDPDLDGLAFRGWATVEDWSGFKTFYAGECERVVDKTTGAVVSDIAAWLRGLKQPVDPMTVRQLGERMREHYRLKKFYRMQIGRMELAQGTGGSSIIYTEITQPDDTMEAFRVGKLEIRLDKTFTSMDDVIGSEPLTIEVDMDDGDGGDRVTCTPCAAGRIDIRDS